MITANSARGLYDNGKPIAGLVTRNSAGEDIMSGSAAEIIPMGRLVGPFVLHTDGSTKLFSELTETDLISDGVSVYSTDAINKQSDLQYDANESIGVINSGYVIVETDSDLAADNTPLTVVNGEGSGDALDIGKLSQTTGVGYSTTTGIRMTRKISATLIEIKISGQINLVAGA